MVQIEDVIPVAISLRPPCKGCQHGFERDFEDGKWWHVWEGRAYPCLDSDDAEQRKERQ